jgi:hypothetical protein
MRALRWLSVAALLGSGTACAADAEIAYSAFGTVGYARSNQSYAYDRFIDDSGTFRRDSVAGATVQVKAAPSTNDDRRYQGSLSWAFLSYRPTNDWLFRVGKQRIPLYLYSETVDVGVSYDFARLPIEMYSIAPSNDFVGAAARRTFRLGDGELAIDLLYGRSSNEFREFLRDDIPAVQSRGSDFIKLTFKGAGLTVSYKDDDRQFRMTLLRARIKQDDGQPFPVAFPFVPIAPGIGYYQTSDALPGPGVPVAQSVVNTLFTLGAEFPVPGGVRVTGEFARAVVRHSEFAPQGNRGYLALLRPTQQWTPYVSFAFLRSPTSQLDGFTKINGNSLPLFIPGAALINAAQRAGADADNAYDQHSWAIGTSYALTSTSKLKAEFLATHIGRVSELVDAASGTTPRDLSIKTFSASYSVVFQ